MYSNKSNDLSPICTTNKDQLPTTPDVLKATFYFYSHNTQYVQNKTTIHLASTTTYKIYNIHKLHQSAPPQASGRQDPRGCPLRGWPHARHRGAARASLREWNIPLPYMGPSTVLNAVFVMKQGPVGYRIICVRLFKLIKLHHTVSYL